MNELIKKLVYNTVGTAVVTNGKIKELIEDLIQNRAFTEDEGKRVVLQAIHNSEDAVNAIELKVTQTVNQILVNLNLPNTDELKLNLENLKEEIKSNGIFNKIRKSNTSLTKQ